MIYAKENVMSKFHKYDPDAMFPRRKEEKFWTWERIVRWVIIVILSAFVIFIGAGCQNIKTVELDFGGLEVEYFPSHPSQEEKSIFDFSTITNRVNAVPAEWDGPLLMPMERK